MKSIQLLATYRIIQVKVSMFNLPLQIRGFSEFIEIRNFYRFKVAVIDYQFLCFLVTHMQLHTNAFSNSFNESYKFNHPENHIIFE